MNKYKHEYLLQQVNRLKNKKFEIAILAPLLYDHELLIVQPYTQYPVGSHFIDLYYPDLKLAIEIDEDHHLQQVEEDLNREKTITNCLNCDFIRISTEKLTDCISKKADIKETILGKILELKKLGDFVEWNPAVFDLQIAQKDWPNAIFFKIPEKEELLSSESFREPVNISPAKIRQADLFVGIYGHTITDVFSGKPVDWENTEAGVRNIGKAFPDHPLISSGTTTWNVTSNKAFGNNLKQC